MAPGSRLTQERADRRDGEPPHPAGGDQRGVPQPGQADLVGLHRGLLLQAAHRQGAAGAAQQGADRAQQLPEGRDPERAARRPVRARPRRRPRPTATSSARATSSSSCSSRASRSSAIVNNGLLPLSRELGMPLVCTNDVHYLRRDDFRPHDILLCIGTGKTVNDAARMRYYGDQFYLKTPEEMAAGLRPRARGAAQHGGDRRAVQRRPVRHGARTCRTSRCPRGSRSRATSSTSCARASRCAWRGCRSCAPPARCATRSRSTGRACSTEIDVIKRMQYPGTS